MPVTLEQLTTRLENIDVDANTLGKIVNDAADTPNAGQPSGTVTTRSGNVVKNAARVLQDLRQNATYKVPVDFGAGLLVDDPAFTVRYNGNIYAPSNDSPNFTTTATFVPTEWELVANRSGMPWFAEICADGVWRVILVKMGQSNAVGKGETGGITAYNSLVKVYDQPNNQIVEATYGFFNTPDAADMGLTTAHRIAEKYGVEVIVVDNAQGGLSIDNWHEPLQGNSAPTLNMWTPLTTDVPAALSLAGATKAHILFAQGESDSNMPLDEYYIKLDAIIDDLIDNQPWFVRGFSLFMDVEMGTANLAGKSDKQIWSKQLLSGKRPDIHKILRTRLMPMKDALHFSGESTDAIGAMAEQTLTAPALNTSVDAYIADNSIIDLHPTGTTGVLFNNLQDIWYAVSASRIEPSKIVIINLKPGDHIYKSLVVDAANSNQIIFRGAPVSGTEPTASNLTGTYSTDLSAWESYWPSRLRPTGQALALVSPVHAFENLLIAADVNADGVVLGSETGDRYSGSSQFRKVGIIGFNEAGVEGRYGGKLFAPGALGSPELYISHCQDALKLNGAQVWTQGALISRNLRYGVYCGGFSDAYVDNADIVNNASNDLFVAGEARATIQAKNMLTATTSNRTYNSTGGWGQTVYGNDGAR
jgi:hypothetical protein